MKELKPGDVVKLKSGGPKMTVKGHFSTKGGWVCHWFVENEIKEAAFIAEQLEDAK